MSVSPGKGWAAGGALPGVCAWCGTEAGLPALLKPLKPGTSGLRHSPTTTRHTHARAHTRMHTDYLGPREDGGAGLYFLLIQLG